MPLRRRIPLRLIVPALIGLGLAPTLTRADGPRGAEWASRDALAYLEIPDPGDLLDRATDPEFVAFLRSLGAYRRAVEGEGIAKARAGADLVTTLIEAPPDEALRKLAGGGIVVVVEPGPESTGKAPRGARPFLAITPTDPAFLVKAHARLLAAFRATAIAGDAPDPVAESTHRGVTIYRVGPDLAHAIVRDTLVIANDPATLRSILDRSADGSGFAGLASDPDWQARRAANRVATKALAWGVARLDKLRVAVPKAIDVPAPKDAGTVALFGPWIEAIRTAPWAAARLVGDGPGFALDLDLGQPAGGPTATSRKFLPPAGQGAPALLKPKGVVASLGLWRDLGSLWEARSTLLPKAAVEGLAPLDGFAAEFFGGRDFGPGILEPIGPNWRLVVADPGPTPGGAAMTTYPAVALVVDLAADKPGDEGARDEFARQLRVAFQTFVGLANVEYSRAKSPTLEIATLEEPGASIATAKFVAPRGKPGPGTSRLGLSPTIVRVGDRFVLSSTLGLTRELVATLKAPAPAGPPADGTLRMEVDGAAIARLLEANRDRLVANNMLEKGTDKATATDTIDGLLAILRRAGGAAFTVREGESATSFRLKVGPR